MVTMNALSDLVDFAPDPHLPMDADGCFQEVTVDQRPQTSSKIDPSFKSKRYRDKLRAEIKALEVLLPVDRAALHRKLDSQTVFRLVIAYFRTKLFLKAAGLASEIPDVEGQVEQEDEGEENEEGEKQQQQQQHLQQKQHQQHQQQQQQHQLHPTEPSEDNEEHRVTSLVEGPNLLQVLDGFLVVVTADGTILYVSRNIVSSLGFQQVDLMHRCVYGIVHPDDHHELKMVLEQSLADNRVTLNNQQRPCCVQQNGQSASCKSVSFLIRIKCFNGTTTGYLKMHCSGHMRSLPSAGKSQRTSSHVLFGFCRPFLSVSTDPDSDPRAAGFWSKHELDLRFKQLDKLSPEVIGYGLEDLEGQSFYTMVHPEDLAVFSHCHKSLVQTEEIQTMYFRLQHRDGHWMWMHTRGKVVFKNAKKYSIVFTHCPVREEDSTYIQQETALRQRYALNELMSSACPADPPDFPASCVHEQYACAMRNQPRTTPYGGLREDYSATSLHSPHGQCPSSWHAQSECHSPVFPSTSLPHRPTPRDRPPDNRKRRKLTMQGAPGYPQNNYYTCAFPEAENLYYTSRDSHVHQRSDHVVRSSSDRAHLQPRQYLMHVNGFGVTPQLSPTTLVFQGQLTAFETDTAFPFTSSWNNGYGGHAGYDSCQPPSHCVPQYCPSQPYQPPHGKETSTLHYVPHSRDCAVNNPMAYNMSYDGHVLHKQTTPPTCAVLKHEPDSTTSIYTDRDRGHFNPRTNQYPSSPHVTRSACAYQSSGSVSNGSPQTMCFGERTSYVMDRKPHADLPAIGSFLEYLNDL